MRGSHPVSVGAAATWRRGRGRGGFVLLAVLVVIMMASMVAMSLMFRMRAEDTASSVTLTSEQAFNAAISGVHEAMKMVARSGAGLTDWQDNPRAFRDRFVFDDGVERWYFTLWSPPADDSLQEVRYGLTDEAAKLNVNQAHTAELSKFGRLDPTLIQPLRDFIDADSSQREAGTEESPVLHDRGSAYQVRNGALNTLDELLLVRGFTPRSLYGEDLNLNCRLDSNEDDGDQRAPADNGDGRLDLGLRPYLTVSSYEPNRDSQGQPRTNLNDPRSPLPAVEVNEAFTNFVAALRAQKLRVNHPAELLESSLKMKDRLGRDVEIPSGIGKKELPVLLEHFTATAEDELPGLINVNTASIGVLATVPGIDEPLAEAIVSARKSVSPERRNTIAWLFENDVMDAARFRLIAPRLTARSFQFRFQVVGFGLPSGRYRVLDVMIDSAGAEPSISYLRDITRLGLPFSLENNLSQEASGG
ncbi:MAG: general secretion pathway protein GspK [Verrucomicrobiales bacterium]|nr:general secretion pathway protein GspK [Verrucomicrobiales bacterium]